MHSSSAMHIWALLAGAQPTRVRAFCRELLQGLPLPPPAHRRGRRARHHERGAEGRDRNHVRAVLVLERGYQAAGVFECRVAQSPCGAANAKRYAQHLQACTVALWSSLELGRAWVCTVGVDVSMHLPR